jgi:uncharacterized membrane protein
MILLILGLILWVGAHVWKRVAPDHRAAFGDKGKGIVAIASVVAIVLMVQGYRGADGAFYWGRSGAGTGINNLLMLFAFYLFATSGKATRITRWIRHPQLSAVVVWRASAGERRHTVICVVRRAWHLGAGRDGSDQPCNGSTRCLSCATDQI